MAVEASPLAFPKPAFKDAVPGKSATPLTVRPAPTSSKSVVVEASVLAASAAYTVSISAIEADAAAKTGADLAWVDVPASEFDVAIPSHSTFLTSKKAEIGITITVLGSAERKAAGLTGPALSVSTDVPIDDLVLRIPDSLVADIYGGDYAQRVRWTAVEATSSGRFDQERVVDSSVVTMDSGKSATVMTASAGAVSSSGTGSYAASSLKPSTTWGVATQTGGFTWSYPLAVPPAPTSATPTLSLTYDSQSADGLSASTNNQPSPIGEGWTLNGTGFIERSYVSCSLDDGPSGAITSSGDLCWKTNNATLSLAGRSGALIRDSATGAWRLQDDDGTRIEQLTGTGAGCAANGTYNTECWRLTTTDGTQYFFGLNQLPGWTSGKPSTKSVFTVPVFGNDTGEPCNAASFATSVCVQGWRWNLDYVVDIHGNAQAHYFASETNNYASASGVTTRNYVRSGQIDHIDYGLKATTVYSLNAATARVVFGYDQKGRCSDPVRANCTDEPINGSGAAPVSPSKYPDIPFDQHCAASPCTGKLSPTFWTTTQLNTVTTQSFSSGTYRNVDQWTLGHSFPDPGDGTSAALWLTEINHVGYSGAQSMTEPATVFSGITMQNRVNPTDGLAPLDKWRLSSVLLPSGAVISVNYAPQQCTGGQAAAILAAPETNLNRCFPQWWTPDITPSPSPRLDLFHKYVVASVIADPVTGGGTDQATETYYDYSAGTPAWRYDDSPLLPTNRRTWSQFAGFNRVIVNVGSPTNPALQQSTEYTYYQGMHGDRATSSGGTKTVDVLGSSGVPDSRWFGGQVRRTLATNGVGGPVLSTTTNTPWSGAVTSTDGARTSRTTAEGDTVTTAPLSSGATRTTSVTNTYDGTTGLVLTSSAVNGPGSPPTCTTTTYLPTNTTAWLVGVVKDTSVVATTCAAIGSAVYPQDSVSALRHSYDGLAFGATPIKGDLTKTEGVDYYTGSTAASAHWTVASTATFDAMGRIASKGDALGRVTTTSYVPSASAAAGSGAMTSITTVNPTPFLWSTTVNFDPDRGSQVSMTDPNGKPTTIDHDPLGRTTRVWLTDHTKTDFPSSPSIEYTYSLSQTATSSVATTVLAPGGTVTRYDLYDGLGRLIQKQQVSPAGGTTVTSSSWDSAGRSPANDNAYWTTSVSPSGVLFVPASVTLIPSRTLIEFDGAGRPIVAKLVSLGAERSRTTFAYSGADRVDSTPPTGGMPTTTYTNATGQVTRLVQYQAATVSGTGISTNYVYDARGSMTSMTDDAGHAWSWTFDVRGRKLTGVDPDSGTTSYAYDAVGNVVSTTDARGIVLTTQFDALDRRTSVRKNTPTGALLASWTWDTIAKGQQTSSSAFVGSTPSVNGAEYKTSIGGYDSGYRPTSQTLSIPSSAPAFAGTTYTEQFTYYQDGSPNISKVPGIGGLPAESLRSTYDSLGNLGGLRSASATYISGISYTPTGQTAQIDRSGSTSSSVAFGYDPATSALISSQETTETGGVFAVTSQRSYVRDGVGNATKITESALGATADTQCLDYDYLQNLIEAWTPASGDCAAAPAAAALGGSAAYWRSYGIDAVTGNRTSVTRHSTPSSPVSAVSTYTYPTTGRIHGVTQVSTTGSGMPAVDSYGYDAAGNTTNYDGSTISYDEFSRTGTITTASAVQQNLYGSDGTLLMRLDGAAGNTLYLGSTELHTAPGSSSVTGLRTYSVGTQPVAERTASGGTSTLRWLSTDPVMTATMSIDVSTGAITRRQFDPFGVPLSTATWSSDHAYLNLPSSPTTGLSHLGAREYDPTIGRFLSVDPILAPYNPQQNNGYAYAGNNPVSASDPAGTCALGDGNSCVKLPGSGGSKTKPPASSGGGKTKLPPAGKVAPWNAPADHQQWQWLRDLADDIGASPLLMGAARNPPLMWAAGFRTEEDGILYTRAHPLQLVGGYMDFYDDVFDAATYMKPSKSEFQYAGNSYVLWAWKGDYLNMGAGGEIGFYQQSGPLSEVGDKWHADSDADVPKMTMTLSNADGEIASYAPGTGQPWVGAFDPSVQNPSVNGLTVEAEVTFPNSAMYEAFRESVKGDNTWNVPKDGLKATLRFRRRRKGMR